MSEQQQIDTQNQSELPPAVVDNTTVPSDGGGGEDVEDVEARVPETAISVGAANLSAPPPPAPAAKAPRKKRASAAAALPDTKIVKAPRKREKIVPMGQVLHEKLGIADTSAAKPILLNFAESSAARERYVAFITALNDVSTLSDMKQVTLGDLLMLAPANKTNIRKLEQLIQLDQSIKKLYDEAEAAYEFLVNKTQIVKVDAYARHLRENVHANATDSE